MKVQDLLESFESDQISKITKAINVSADEARSFLFGGGSLKNALGKFTKAGYNDGATTYNENASFWRKVGISKSDFDRIVKLSS